MNKSNNLNVAAASPTASLPIPIYRAREKAEHDYRVWLREIQADVEKKPRLGRPRTRERYTKVALVIGKSPQEVDHKMVLLNEILGPRARGNKRRGSQNLYSDLLEVFLNLRRCGITLPKGGNLSVKAVCGGLGRVLKDHHYTFHTVDELVSDGQERRRLGKVMKTSFARVASVIESNPAP